MSAGQTGQFLGSLFGTGALFCILVCGTGFATLSVQKFDDNHIKLKKYPPGTGIRRFENVGFFEFEKILKLAFMYSFTTNPGDPQLFRERLCHSETSSSLVWELTDGSHIKLRRIPLSTLGSETESMLTSLVREKEREHKLKILFGDIYFA